MLHFVRYICRTMNKFKAYSAIVTGCLLMLGAIGVTLYIKFTNIDATEMRIFVDYWYIHLLAAISAFAGFKLFMYGMIKL